MSGQWVMGVDIGTSSTKGVIVDEAGRVRASASRARPTTRPAPGRAEQDAGRDWWGGFVEVVCELTSASSEPVAALGISAMGPCVALCDAEDLPLRPAILYGVDTRAVSEIAELETRLGRSQVIEQGGVPLTSESVGPKLAWLRRNEPEVWKRAARWHTAASFLLRRLTGRYVIDHGHAAAATPLYVRGRNGEAGHWHRELWSELAPGLEVPALHWSSETGGHVTEAAASLTGLPPGIPVTSGAVDAVAEAWGAGVARPGDCLVMYGTTMLLLQVLDGASATPDPEGAVGVYPGLWPGTAHAAGNMTTAGALLDWVAELTKTPVGALAEAAAKVPVGADGLVVLPYLAGMRTPVFRPELTGSIDGLTLRHGGPHIFRAAVEGIACAAKRNADALRRLGGPAERLVAMGGGLANRLWVQAVSDLLRLPQEIPGEVVGAAYGSAMLAASAVGSADDPLAWVRIAEEVRPTTRPQARSAYELLYAQHLLSEQKGHTAR
ncbi:FGGY family carbohydrate kinase [Streptomyces sp. NPDC002994]|uniref:FGGY-family carbohydrate kinase n=1 Tax=Streptomyces sp. NPDC002994 TaxID=3154441 RepID=UPI0033B4F150